MIFYIALIVTLYLFTGTIYFGYKNPSHSHIKDTISELGEDEAPNAQFVNLGFFLPIGVLLFAIASLSDELLIKGLGSCLGTGYTVAAFFPCDKGAPLNGSWKQQLHNLGGFAQYVGSIYFIHASSFSLMGIDNEFMLMILIFSTFIVSIPGIPIRGLVQRIMEVILFGSLVVATM